MKPPRRAKRWMALVLVECMLLPATALANPAGGVVRGGSATISGEGTSVVDIHQRSQSAVLSWKSFDIQPGEVTSFHQPNAGAIAVNRIMEGQASRILGGLNANGHVYLINPNGILFGPNAVVNVGALTAASSVKAGDLIALGHGFDPSAVSNPGAKIENLGRIQTSPGGFVYLVAPQVENGKSGVIVSPNGKVELAAGATVYLTDRADGLGVAVQYTAPGKPGDAAVNLGKLVADGGLVRLRADLVRQAGVVEANAVRKQGGKVELVADSRLSLEDGSTTSATGGAGVGPGGSVVAKSGGDASVAAGATIDVSGGAQGGGGGTLEVSGKGSVSLAGTVRADGHAGAAGGKVLIDPSELLVTGQQTFSGASTVSLTASRTISIGDNAAINLTNPVGTPTLDVRSGGDIAFGTNARIAEGAGSDATNHWNVQLLAGAQDLTNPSSLALNPASNGGIFLSGAKQLTTGQVVRDSAGEATPLRNNGLVSLIYGDLQASASGDVWIGNGGGLVDQQGSINVYAGRNVRFTASDPSQDGVIQNGSGNINVVAGGSVILTGVSPGADAATPGSPAVHGNAAIRTVGLTSMDAQGNPIQDRGGSIFVQAISGDVDAGVGNRWVQPGPISEDFSGAPTDPTFDKLPVVSQGILGIGSQVGGDVTVIAGGDVYTGHSVQNRSGGSAYRTAGTADYTGSHIGLFGRPVKTAPSSQPSSAFGPVKYILPNPPASRLLVIAGGDITGDYMVREGRAVFRAGYSLVPGTTPTALSADDLTGLAAALQRSGLTADPARGWFGSLAHPVTVDLMEGRAVLDPTDPTKILQSSVDALGANGVAIRAIENPSLVYPPVNNLGTFRAPSYAPTDSARLEAETGDVVLVGNDTQLPVEGGVPPVAQNDLVWLLPPSLTVVTHHFQRDLESRGGDLVILNPFTLFPSSSGGLTLDVAGTVRSPNEAALAAPIFSVTPAFTGDALRKGFTVPGGLDLYDPLTGLHFTLQGSTVVPQADPPIAATASVVFRLAPSAANQPVLVPKGTKVQDILGRTFVFTSDVTIPGPSGRYSQGIVDFFADPSAPQQVPVQIPAGQPILVAPDGTLWEATRSALLYPGQSAVSVPVVAVSAGHDAVAYSLKLVSAIPGIASATNPLATVRLPGGSLATANLSQGSFGVTADQKGDTGAIYPNTLVDLATPLPGILGVTNPIAGIRGRGYLPPSITGMQAKPSLTGMKGSPSLLGPASEAAIGHALLLTANDASFTSYLQSNGINPSDVKFTLGSIAQSTAGLLAPVVLRQLDVERNAAGQITSTRVDPPPGQVGNYSGSSVWISKAAGAAQPGITESDAEASFDARGVNPFDQYAQYYRECRSGAPCLVAQYTGGPAIGTRGAGPTHAADRAPAMLKALGGFDRIAIDLAKSVSLFTDGDVRDLTLYAQNNAPSDVTTIDVPNGNISLGASYRTLVDDQTGTPVTVQVPDDPSSGIFVSGPGKAQVLVGVVPFAQADSNQDGFISPSEFKGSQAVFDSLDTGPIVPDGRLDPGEAPFVPTGSGGELRLPDVQISGTSAGGIETVGNNIDPALPSQGASLTVVSAGDLLLGSRGSIGSLEGGDVAISSIGGAILGGVPGGGSQYQQRGIFSVFAAPNGTVSARPAAATGGGAISVDAFGDIDVGGLAVAALSGSDITLESRGGSISGGVSAPFSKPLIQYDSASNRLTVSYQGGGIYAAGGQVIIKARKNVDIGAGITGAGITIDAGQNVLAGQGAIQSSGAISIGAGGTISGNISAAGSVVVTSGTVTQGSSVSSTSGLVAGAGSVGSNTGGAKTSAETNLAGQQVADNGSMAGGAGVGEAGGGPRRGVRIEVTSTPVGSSGTPPVSSPPCKGRKNCR